MTKEYFFYYFINSIDKHSTINKIYIHRVKKRTNKYKEKTVIWWIWRNYNVKHVSSFCFFFFFPTHKYIEKFFYNIWHATCYSTTITQICSIFCHRNWKQTEQMLEKNWCDCVLFVLSEVLNVIMFEYIQLWEKFWHTADSKKRVENGIVYLTAGVQENENAYIECYNKFVCILNYLSCMLLLLLLVFFVSSAFWAPDFWFESNVMK